MVNFGPIAPGFSRVTQWSWRPSLCRGYGKFVFRENPKTYRRVFGFPDDFGNFTQVTQVAKVMRFTDYLDQGGMFLPWAQPKIEGRK